MQQIKSFGILQTATISAAFYFAFSLVFLVPFVLISFAVQSQGPNQPPKFLMWFLWVAPFFYAVFGFVFTAFACWIYNMIAKLTGGIEFELTESSS